MGDESCFVKKGMESVGVARQYCGSLGKVENCQVGVFAAYASRHGYALVDKRLFMPETWFGEDYAERRHKCHVPEELRFHTKSQWAAEMVTAIRGEGRLPFKYVGSSALLVNQDWTTPLARYPEQGEELELLPPAYRLVLPRHMPTAAMAYENIGCPGQGSLPPLRLGGLHHTLPQELDVCPSIALALEQLQAVDMALDGTIAPGQGE